MADKTSSHPLPHVTRELQKYFGEEIYTVYAEGSRTFIQLVSMGNQAIHTKVLTIDPKCKRGGVNGQTFYKVETDKLMKFLAEANTAALANRGPQPT